MEEVMNVAAKAVHVDPSTHHTSSSPHFLPEARSLQLPGSSEHQDVPLRQISLLSKPPAMVLRLHGYGAWVESDGKPLQEYAVEVKDNVISCYICSEEGKVRTESPV